MAFGLHPVVLLAILGTILAIIGFSIACSTKRTSVRIAFGVFALLCLLPAVFVFVTLYPETIDARFRAYKRLYHDLKPGMTRAEVFSVMDKYYPAGGERKRPKILSDESDGLSFFMHPENSREPNCEGIFISLQNGRVATKVYSRD